MTDSQSDILLQAAELYPEKIAIIIKNSSITFSELNDRVNKAVANLASFGFRKGEIVAVLDKNSIEYITAFWTAFRMGLVFMPLNTKASANDWADQIETAKCRVLFYGKEFSHCFELAQNSFPLKMLSRQPLREVNTDYSPSCDDDAVIMFSSGSTGKPRGIVLSRDNLFHSAIGANNALHTIPDDRWLAVLPLYHVGGLSILYRAILSGSVVCVTSEFNAVEAITCVEQYESVLLSVVPTMLQELLEVDEKNHLASCKAVILGGAGFDVSLRNSIVEKNLPVLTTYGMTETSSMITLVPLNEAGTHLDSSGKVLEGREIKISECAHILVRGRTVFSRTVDGQKKIDDNGWFDTGDLGSISEDGYLSVTGRADRMIVSGGENIDLTRIENDLSAITGIETAIVLSRSDHKWGERPIAFIKLKNPELTGSEISNIISDKLGKIHTPDRIIFIDEVPLTASGKINFGVIKKSFSGIFDEQV